MSTNGPTDTLLMAPVQHFQRWGFINDHLFDLEVRYRTGWGWRHMEFYSASNLLMF